jgi:hypothetical protein
MPFPVKYNQNSPKRKSIALSQDIPIDNIGQCFPCKFLGETFQSTFARGSHNAEREHRTPHPGLFFDSSEMRENTIKVERSNAEINSAPKHHIVEQLDQMNLENQRHPR